MGKARARIETTAQDTIDFQEVCVDLPNGTPLLASVTLSLRPHEAVLLKGSSGCGKSTLFRVLTGLWPFATGRIRLPQACRRCSCRSGPTCRSGPCVRRCGSQLHPY